MTNNRHEIAFLLADLPDVDSLQAGLPEQIDTHLLGPRENALGQILATLERHPAWGQVTALHLISHGAPGRLELGEQHLDLANLDEHQSPLIQPWSFLKSSADFSAKQSSSR